MDLNAVLVNLMSPDNATRMAAEAQLDEAQKTPDPFLNALLRILADSDRQEMRMMASILIRKVLVRDEEGVWDKLSDEMKMTTKQGLLSFLVHDHPKNIRRKICDTLAELCIKQGEHPGRLTPQLFEWAVGQNQHLRLSSLLILAQLIKVVIHEEHQQEISQSVPQMLHAVQSNITLQQAEAVPIRIAALDLYTTLVTQTNSPQQQEAWASLLPLSLQLLGDLLNQGLEREVSLALQLLNNIAELDMKGKLLKRRLGEFAQAMAQVASHAQLDEGIRGLALEFLLTIAANAPVACRKLPNFPDTLFSIAINFMLNVDDDLADWNQEDPDDEDLAPEGYALGEEALDRMAMSLRWKAIRGPCQRVVQQFMQSPDWKHRHAALMAISQVGEVIPEEELNPVIGVALHSFGDQHPRVRWAAINTIGQLSSDFGPYVQNHFHAEVVPRLIAGMQDRDNARVQAHAASAMINFAEHLEPELLMPYIDVILAALQGMLQSQNEHVRVHALPAIASVADVAEGHFSKYYSTFMPFLKGMLQHAHAHNQELVRAKVIECISLIAVAVGKEVFGPDSQEVIAVMLAAQNSTVVKVGDPQHSYMLSSWTRICKCLGRDFVPYLPTVMPPLLETVKLDDVVEIDDDSDDESPEQVHVNTGLLDDKSTAVNMLYVYSSELKGGFYPWVHDVFTHLVPCLKFVYVEDIRATAALCMPELVKCVVEKCQAENATSSGEVKQLVDTVMAELLEGIAHEMFISKFARPGSVEEDAMVSMLEGLRGSIEAAGRDVLDKAQVEQVFALIVTLVEECDQKHAKREESKAGEEFDEELGEQLEEEYDKDDDILTECSMLFSATIKSCAPAMVMEQFESQLRDVFLSRMGAEHTTNNRKMALCVFDDVLERGNPASLPYLSQVLQALVQSVVDEDPGVRQAAAYGVGSAAEHCITQFSPMVQFACEALVRVVVHPESRSPSNESATDNAVSAMGKIMVAMPRTSQALMGPFMEYLPLNSDMEESKTVSKTLLALLARDMWAVLGEKGERTVKLLQVFASMFRADSEVAKPEDVQQAKVFLSQLSSHHAQLLQEAFAKLPPSVQQDLQL